MAFLLIILLVTTGLTVAILSAYASSGSTAAESAIMTVLVISGGLSVVLIKLMYDDFQADRQRGGKPRNPESFESCSHGAGRVLSRNEARRRFSLADHLEATAGVECRKDEAVLDETPGAYKPIDAVMAAQKDLVEVLHTLKQVVCVKG